MEYNHCHQISLLNNRNFPGMPSTSDKCIAIELEPLNPGLCPLCIYFKIRVSDDQTSARDVINVFSRFIWKGQPNSTMHFFQNSNSLEKRKQLNEGLPMSWLWPPSSSSPSVFSLHYIYSGLPTVPQTHWAHFCLTDFEFAIPSAWSVLPLGCAQSLLPTSLRSLCKPHLPSLNQRLQSSG